MQPSKPPRGCNLFLVVLGLLVTLPCSTRALTNGLALTPPMGWNSWNYFACNVSDAMLRGIADAMATNGMKAAGYQYINIDDCWQVARDANGVIVPDPVRFPNGIKGLADYVHSKGLKLGVYSDHGLETCQGRPGSYGYEYLDANTYAAWGVDYLKFDACALPPGDVPQLDYARMADALMKCGRPITFSICAWQFLSWMADSGNLWRTGGDIDPTFPNILWCLGDNSPPAFVAGPGRWNDADMLEVGNGSLTVAENQAHFSLWCIVASPLIAGNDLTAMSAQTLSILTNAELIAVNQDPAGEQGVPLANTSTNQLWVKPLGTDFTTKAVALFNPNTSPTSITVNWSDIGLRPGSATVRDLWAKVNLGAFNNSFTTNVPAHGVVVLKVAGTAPLLPGLGTNYLTDLQPAYSYTGSGSLTNNRSIGGNALRLNGTTYTKGLGVNALSGFEYRLGGIASRFQSDIGVDDEVGATGSAVFQVLADGTKIYDSGILRGGAAHQSIDLDVTGVNRLTLGVIDADDGISNDHADWAGARVVISNTVPAPPLAPTGLSASRGIPMSLSWNATRSALSYNIKRALASTGPYTNLASSALPAYSDASVAAGTTYYYVVTAVSAFGDGAGSSPASALACAQPAAPTGVTAAANDRQATISWNPVPGATSYSLARALPSTPYTSLADGLASTTYTNLNLTNGVNYSYVVYANNACTQSGRSALANATPNLPPGTPTGLTATTGGTRAVLQWNAAAAATSYKLKRAITSAGPFATVATNITTLSYLDTGLLAGTTYYYVIAGVNSVGDSPDSGYAIAATCSGTLPPGWSHQDIGSVGYPGSATCCGCSLVLQGSGDDIWNNADVFHFASTPITGDSTIVARVTSVQNTDPWAKAGVMFRNDSTAGSVFVDMVVTPGNGINLQWRTTANNGCSYVNVSGVAAPAWVKLVRSSNTFTGSYSLDGTTWTQVGSRGVTMGSTALAGLAVTAHNNGLLCLAAFDFASTARPVTPIGLSAAANLSQATLTWSPATGAPSYNIRRALASAGPYTNLLNLAATSFADTNVANGTTYYYEVSAVNPIGESAYSAPVGARLPLPTLSAALTNHQLILSWPVTASSFLLSSATNLSAPATWTAATNPTATSNGQVTATQPLTGKARFYRLISP